MPTQQMSEACKHYIRWRLRGVPFAAFLYLSQVRDSELFRALAAPAREDIDDIFGDGPDLDQFVAGKTPAVGSSWSLSKAAAAGPALMPPQVLRRLPQMQYAFAVVSRGDIHFTKPAPPTPAAQAAARDYLLSCVAMREIPLEIDEDLTGSLPAPVANPTRLSEADYKAASVTLGVDVPAVKAVASVESSGSGFGDGGLPVIRFELHRFQSKTNKHFHKTHPFVSQFSPQDGGRTYHPGT